MERSDPGLLPAPADAGARVVHTRNVFRPSERDTWIESEATTLGELAESRGWLVPQMRVRVDGELVPATPDLALRRGMHVEIVTLPGLTGLEWLAIALIVLSVVSLTLSLLQFFLATKPKSQKRSEDVPDIGGRANAVRRFAAIPSPYGLRRVWPDTGALGWTEIRGGEVYFRQFFTVGYGPCLVDEHRFGDTLLSSLGTGVTEIEVRQGWPGGIAEPSLAANAISTATDIITSPLTTWRDKDGVKILDIYDGLEIEFLDGPLAGERKRITASGPIATFQRFTCVPGFSGAPDPGDTFRIQDITHELFPSAVVEREVNVALGTRGVGSTGPHIRAAANGSQRLGVILFSPTGFVATNNKGSQKTIYMDVLLQYRPTGSADPWIDVPADADLDGVARFSQDGLLVVQGEITRNFYIGVNWDVPAGDWEVKVHVTEFGAGANSQATQKELQWRSLQGIAFASPWELDGICTVSVVAKGTHALSGSVDAYNAKVQRLLRVWSEAEGEMKVHQATRSPAWAVLEELTGFVNPRPASDADVDMAGLDVFDDFCIAEGFTYDANPKQYAETQEQIDNILGLSRASLTLRDGTQYGVIIDDDRTAEAPVSLISPVSIIRGTSSIQRDFDEAPHAARVVYVNEDDNYTDDEQVVYRDGFDASTATLIREINVADLVNGDHAYKHAKFELEQKHHRRRVYRFEAELEHALFLQRGDLTLYASAISLLGTGTRVKDKIAPVVDVTHLVLYEEVEFLDGEVYTIDGRRNEGDMITGVSVVNPATPTDPVVRTHTVELTTPTAPASMFNIGASVVFGPTRRCLVSSIEHRDGLVAQFELIDEAPEIWASLSGGPPAYTPPPSIPPNLAPGAPWIDNLIVKDGHLIITLRGRAGRVPPQLYEAQIRESGTGQWPPRIAPLPGSAGSAELDLGFVQPNRVYDIRARALGGEAQILPSPWNEITSYVVDSHGILTEIEVTGLEFSGLGSKTVLETEDYPLDWRLNARGIVIDPLTDPPLDQEKLAAALDGYVIIAENPDGSIARRVDAWKTVGWTYTNSMNREDHGGFAARAMTFRVAARRGSSLSEFKQISGTNPAPPMLIFGQQKIRDTHVEQVIELRGDHSDRAGVRAWASTSSGFTPSNENLVYDGDALEEITITGGRPGDFLFYRIAEFDSFSRDPESLNLTDELPALLKTIDTINITEEAISEIDSTTTSELLIDKTGIISNIEAQLFAHCVQDVYGGEDLALTRFHRSNLARSSGLQSMSVVVSTGGKDQIVWPGGNFTSILNPGDYIRLFGSGWGAFEEDQVNWMIDLIDDENIELISNTMGASGPTANRGVVGGDVLDFRTGALMGESLTVMGLPQTLPAASPVVEYIWHSDEASGTAPAVGPFEIYPNGHIFFITLKR